jgi:NAD(P)-dependent dehydrogenase (short-subunit alcohol dehydrogenase family)
MPVLVVLGARNLGRAILEHHLGAGWSGAAVARSAESLDGISGLASQSPRAYTHELVVTPAGERWLP